jgi:hypothetical protein
MLRHLLLAGLIVVGAASMPVSAQPFPPPGVTPIGYAGALAARIRAFHRWAGLAPPPVDYCATMREGEAVQKELARRAARAILYREPGVALELQRVGDALSDALDFEEEINRQAEIPFTEYPCPVPAPAYPARAVVLRLVGPRLPGCQRQANALRASFEARRDLMQQCLRIPGT